jgi:hypothetical protein
MAASVICPFLINEWPDYQADEEADDDQGRLFPGKITGKFEHGNLALYRAVGCNR